MRTVLRCLMLMAAACTNPTSAEDRVTSGTWGGEHVALDVTASGARIEYDCAHGSLDEPLALDRSGRFDVTGTHTPEHGGPVHEGEEPELRPARYAGRVDGRRMALTVTLTDTGDMLGPFALTQGVGGRLTKCL